MALSCHICKAEETKYKCASCKAPTCSLQCFKDHKAYCRAAVIRDPIQAAQETEQLEVKRPKTNPALDASDLQSLFDKYPALRPILKQIYESTREPAQRPDAATGARNNRPPQLWKPGKGVEAGTRALEAALQSDDVSADAIEAFMNLLAHKNAPRDEVSQL